MGKPFFQNQLNVLDSDTLNARRMSLKGVLSNSDGMVDWWQEGMRNGYNPSYAQWVDEIIQEIEQEEAAA